MTTVGLLYPGYSAEDDFAALDTRLQGIDLPLVHTSVGEDAHAIGALLDLGNDARLADGAAELVRHHRLDSVLWACTSGSFVFGPDGAQRQVDALARAAGVPASSTSFAFVRAARSLGAERVVVAASYPDDVARAFVDFLAAFGIGVTELCAHDIYTAAEVGLLGRDEVVELVGHTSRSAGSDATAVLVPDTAMHTLSWIPELEDVAGMPVLTANQVTVWEGLRLTGGSLELPGLGTLFDGTAG